MRILEGIVIRICFFCKESIIFYFTIIIFCFFFQQKTSHIFLCIKFGNLRTMSPNVQRDQKTGEQTWTCPLYLQCKFGYILFWNNQIQHELSFPALIPWPLIFNISVHVGLKFQLIPYASSCLRNFSGLLCPHMQLEEPGNQQSQGAPSFHQ